MRRVPTRLVGPIFVPYDVPDTVFTAPAGGALIREILLCNESDDPVQFYMSIGTFATSKLLYDPYTVPARTTVPLFHYLPLADGEILEMAASLEDVLTVTIGGDLNNNGALQALVMVADGAIAANTFVQVNTDGTVSTDNSADTSSVGVAYSDADDGDTLLVIYGGRATVLLAPEQAIEPRFWVETDDGGRAASSLSSEKAEGLVLTYGSSGVTAAATASNGIAEISVIANAPGTAGNDIGMVWFDPAAPDVPLSASWDVGFNRLEVTLATDSGSVIISTVQDAVDIANLDPDFSALATMFCNNNCSDLAVAQPEMDTGNGLDATPGASVDILVREVRFRD
jgi:hypothetical protein